MAKTFTLSDEEHDVLIRYIDTQIDEINDFLISDYATPSVTRFWVDEKNKLKNVLKKLQNNKEVTK